MNLELKNILLIASVFLLQQYIMFAENTPHSFGIIFGPTIIFNNTSIPLIPGADDCGTFKDGIATSFFGGLYYNYSIYPDFLSIDARLFYEYRSANLSEKSSGYEVYSPLTNSYLPLIRQHNYTGSLEYIAMDLGAKYQPLIAYPAFVRLGFEAGNPIISSNYENTEQIVSPEGVLFPNETLTNRIAGGNITNTTSAYALSLGISYLFKLKSELIIEPGISYRKSLNSILSNLDWNQDIFRLSLSIGINLQKSVPNLIRKKETVIAPKEEQIIATKQLVESFKAGEILVQETIVTQTYPILPYIFFDSLANSLKSVYVKNGANNFDESKLPKDNLEIYYRLLDLIGYRLKNNPDIHLYINGTQDGSERIASPDNSLAVSRAKTISDYLTKIWQIKPVQIKTGFIDKPTLATSEIYPEGYQENRRVELSSNNPKLFQPVVHTKYSEFNFISNNLILSSTLSSDNLNWDISFDYDNKVIKKLSGFGKLPTTLRIVDILSNVRFDPTKSLKVILTVKDKDSKSETVSQFIPFQIDKNKFELGRLNLIVFDFDKSELTDINQLMIDNFAGVAIKDDSNIDITGSTDRLGEVNYNQKLSKSRAENVRNFLLKIKPSTLVNEIKGVGSSSLKYDNDTPEGRFYSRTVLIEVKTPLK